MLTYRTLCALFLLASFSLTPGKPAVAQDAHLPRVFSWIPEKVAASRARALSGDPALQPAIKKLQVDAEAAAEGPLVAVTDKPVGAMAPSGDPHDYTSISIYFWPDTDDPKAPWVMKDGQRNREAINRFDGPRMSQMIRRVTLNAQAWYFTGEEKYAKTAADQLRHWFLNPATRMNANLNFAQSVPNKSAGSWWGIIDANQFPELINSVGLLEGSRHWTATDEAALRDWFRQFADWLWNSDLGRADRKALNNHGTFYDAMVASAALYAGNEQLARTVLESVGPVRIAHQVQPDGSTPEEQKRVGASGYTTWNLKGFADLLVLGQKLGIDLWSYQTPDGRSLRKAAHWLIPFVEGKQPWSYGDKKFSPTDPTDAFWILSSVTGDEEIARVFRTYMTPESTRDRWATSRMNLLYPIK